MMTEVWRAHPEFTDYEVSDLGRVRRATAKRGAVVGKVLKLACTTQGYRHVKINGKSRRVYALVLQTFVGPRPSGAEVRHLNENKGDDRLKNIAWGTHAENYADRVKHGGGNQGSRHGMAKLTEADIRSIRARYKRKVVTQKMLAAEYGVTRECVKLIVSRKRWNHV